MWDAPSPWLSHVSRPFEFSMWLLDLKQGSAEAPVSYIQSQNIEVNEIRKYAVVL